jgi:hypothetical protein
LRSFARADESDSHVGNLPVSYTYSKRRPLDLWFISFAGKNFEKFDICEKVIGDQESLKRISREETE